MEEFAGFIIGVLVVILVVAGIVGAMFAVPAFSRYQTRAYAMNEVTVNNIRIQQQEQLVKVEKQKAEIRVVEAQGIATSQHIIDQSLTNNYLQYLAIKAQENMAHSPNHTQIYIPVGTNGIPLIKTVDAPVPPAEK